MAKESLGGLKMPLASTSKEPQGAFLRSLLAQGEATGLVE
jgi:hypothetical protein